MSIAIVRPDAWNFPLLVHVLGAMVMVGALILAGSALVFAWRAGSASLLRLGYRSLVFGALPAWIVMRAGAQWIASKESLTDSNVSWIGIGFTTSDAGIVLILAATVLAAIAMRRAAASSSSSSSAAFNRTAAVLVSILLIAYLVTIWAMTTKPT